MSLSIWLTVRTLKAKEFLLFDSPVLIRLAYMAYRLSGLVRNGEEHLPSRLNALGFVWRTTTSPALAARCEADLKKLDERFGAEAVTAAFSRLSAQRMKPKLIDVYRQTILDGKDLFKKRVLILKAPANGPEGEKGVLLIANTDVFSYFLHLFDARVFDAYHVVLEPSWVGFFLPDVMQFRQVKHKVWVQAGEEKDEHFVRTASTNLVPLLDTTANTWVNPEIFKPVEGTEKIYDLAVVSGWGDFKRHHVLFAALRKIRHLPIKVACAGMVMNRTLDHMKALAAHYGVQDKVDFYYDIPASEISKLFNKSKAHMLLSRKEGTNRAIIEAMFAGTPSFIQEGMNYGRKYGYINSLTGGVFRDAGLPALLEKIHREGCDSYNPRSWVMKNMAPEVSTRKLEEAIFGDYRNRLKVKVNTPELDYLNRADRTDLDEAYSRLKMFLKGA